MLEKNPGNIDMECLQIILLFEADCNQNNKWIGHAFMKEAELANLMADEQYRAIASRMQSHNAWRRGCGMILSIWDGNLQLSAQTMQRVAMTKLFYW